MGLIRDRNDFVQRGAANALATMLEDHAEQLAPQHEAIFNSCLHVLSKTNIKGIYAVADLISILVSNSDGAYENEVGWHAVIVHLIN